MAAKTYFARFATLSFAPDGGTAITIGHLQNVEITVEYEEEFLTACGSIKIQDRCNKDVKVKVKAELLQIDIDLTGDMLSPSGTTYTAGTDTLTGIENTSTVSLYDVVGTITTTAGDTLTATVSDVSFPTVPIISASKDDGWVPFGYEGTGADLALVLA